METWKDIPGYPDYQISARGLVYSERRGRILKASPNQRGIYQVGLMQGGVQKKVSVAHLVANAFLPRAAPRFDTIIHLDNNGNHNHVENLAWRPRTFTLEYKKQFIKPCRFRINEEIFLVQTEEVFPDSITAATAYGLLERAVCISAFNIDYDTPVFPTGQIFKILRLIDTNKR